MPTCIEICGQRACVADLLRNGDIWWKLLPTLKEPAP